MINWKNLEKFIAPGKVVTLVLLVDGEEVGAFSFNVDSLAFKEALEAASHLDPVKVAEKKTKPDAIDDFVKATATGDKKGMKKATEAMMKPEPEPMDKEEPEEEDEDVDSDGVPVEPEHNDIDKVFVPETKPMTREQIMMQSEPQRGSVSSGPVKEPEKKMEENKNQLKLTDEW